MNGKLHPGEDLSSDLLNPFVHRLELASTYDKIKTAVFTVAVLPLRVLAIMALLVLAWLLACVGLLGLSDEDLRTKPMTGWRKKLRAIISVIGRWSYQMGGMSLVVRGQQVDRSEAPILVIAPHSTFLDAGIVYVTGFPSIIVRRESGLNPWLGKLINYTQPVYVWREDPMSRQNSIKEIIQRATSPLDWPQVLIFPEGTCTNRSCLITFKPGAFYPGVPVQPVCIRYPNKLDTVTWTWEGPGALKLLWLTLTQPHSSCEIEFLPVYTPSEEEKRNPKLFANNVRLLMAKALGVPVSDYTYNDCRLLTRVKQMNLPHAANLLEVQKLRTKLGLTVSLTEERLVAERPHGPPALDWSSLDLKQFAECLSVSPAEPATKLLFQLYEKDGAGVVDLREYLVGVLAITKANSLLETVQLAFQVYDRSGLGRLGVQETAEALIHSMSMTREDAHDVFRQVDRQGRGYVTFGEFENYAQRRSEFSHLFPVDTHPASNARKKDTPCPNMDSPCPGERLKSH